MRFLDLGEKWAEELARQPEIRTGLQVAKVTLKDGTIIQQVNIWWGRRLEVPSLYTGLMVDDIVKIEVI
jgi:hypothetical protein